MLLIIVKKLHVHLCYIFFVILFYDLISIFYLNNILDLEFLLFILSGLIMLYGGLMGMGATSPSIQKLGALLKLSSSKGLTQKKMNIATQNTVYYFILGIYLLVISNILAIFIRMINLILTS